MDDHVPKHSLFVLEVTTSCETYLNELEKRLVECPGTVSVEVNEKIKEVRVRGNVKPLDLIAIMGEEAELAYYNKDPARIDEFQSESTSKEKQKYSGRKKQEEDHYKSNGKGKEKYNLRKTEEDNYKPYVYKEHDPVYFPSSISGQEFFDYFGGVRSDHRRNHRRYDVPMEDPYAEFPDHSHSKPFKSSVPLRRSVLPPYFY